MRLSLRCFFYLVLTSVLNASATIALRNDLAEKSLHVRVRRQDGYVYDKPSVSFELPSRSTIESTQAPTVDRTLAQQMFYAYPALAPAGGNTINIGTTVGPAATTTPTGAAAGYNYRSATTANAGYAYETSGPAVVPTNTASQVTNTGSQTFITGSQTNTGSSQASGYGYNAPVPILSPSLQGSTEVSTNAPKYLPPGTGGGTEISTGDVTIGSVTVTSGTSTDIATQAGSIGTPSESYLPPLGTSNIVSTGQTSSSSTGVQTKGGSISIPSTAYLPPIPSPSPTPSPAPTITSQPATPAGAYIPPSNTGSNTGTISTPASGYLPPGFF